MDPVASTNLFLDALLRQPDWSTVEPWRAAQDVQRSAFTGVPSPSNGFSPVYGGNYLAQAGEATRIVDLIKIDSAKLNCGGGPGDPPTGPIGANGLPVGYRIPVGDICRSSCGRDVRSGPTRQALRLGRHRPRAHTTARD